MFRQFVKSCALVLGTPLALIACSDLGYTPATGDHLVFVGHPADVVAGQPLRSFAVAIHDSTGATVPALDGIVRLTLAGAAAVLVGETTAPIEEGQARFDAVSVSGPGEGLTLVATIAGLTASSRPFAAVEAPDIIVSRNVEGQRGFLVDGRTGAGFVDDSALITSDSVAPLIMFPADSSNELVGFARGHAPVLVAAAAWTPGVDTARVEFAGPVRIAITAWILYGDFDTVGDTARAAILGAEDIFASERAGIAFSEIEIVDVTGDPDAPNFLDCCQVVGSDADYDVAIAEQIGKREGRINIYGVRSISFTPGTTPVGIASVGGDFVALVERGWNARTVAHELGHTFSLLHPDQVSGFGTLANLMGSSTHHYLTEGQVFHMHFSGLSALNLIYGLRAPAETRMCFNGVTSSGHAGCVRLDLSIWNDAVVVAASPAPPLVAEKAVRIGELIP